MTSDGGEILDGWGVDPFKTRAAGGGGNAKPIESPKSMFGEPRTSSGYSGSSKKPATSTTEPPPMSEEMRQKLKDAKSISSADFELDYQVS